MQKVLTVRYHGESEASVNKVLTICTDIGDEFMEKFVGWANLYNCYFDETSSITCKTHTVFLSLQQKAMALGLSPEISVVEAKRRFVKG